MTQLILLVLEFFKIGLFAIGGGLATLPFLYDLTVTHPDWVVRSQLLDMVAISESTPGALGVNMATYVGNVIAGPLGGVATTLGLVAPSVIIIVIVAKFLERFKDSPIVQNVFYGIRPASIGLIMAAAFVVIKEALMDIPLFSETGSFADLFRIKSIIFGIILYIAMVKFKKHPILYIAIAAIVGNIISF